MSPRRVAAPPLVWTPRQPGRWSALGQRRTSEGDLIDERRVGGLAQRHEVRVALGALANPERSRGVAYAHAMSHDPTKLGREEARRLGLETLEIVRARSYRVPWAVALETKSEKV